MKQLNYFGIKTDKSPNRSGVFKTKKQADEVAERLGLTAYKRMDGSWDLE